MGSMGSMGSRGVQSYGPADPATGAQALLSYAVHVQNDFSVPLPTNLCSQSQSSAPFYWCCNVWVHAFQNFEISHCSSPLSVGRSSRSTPQLCLWAHPSAPCQLPSPLTLSLQASLYIRSATLTTHTLLQTNPCCPPYLFLVRLHIKSQQPACRI